VINSAPNSEFPDPAALPAVGLLPRLAAYFVDQLVLLPLMYGVYVFMIERSNLAGVVIFWGLQHLYKPLLEARFGQTAGKAILGLRVVSQHDLGPITLNQSFVRYLPWAVMGFANLFVLIRAFQSIEIAEVQNLETYVSFITTYPLTQNFLVNLCNNFPVFSAVWMIMDPWRRALHDRWAQTYVLKPVNAAEP
jgi:uncharacterized RDD family membrane protein YckC